MTGTCKLCREIVTGAPVLEVGPEREAAEFFTFAEAMRKHIAARHMDAIQMYAGVLTVAAAYFSSLFADCSIEGFTAAQEQLQESICNQIRDAQVVIGPAAPVNRPLVVPS